MQQQLNVVPPNLPGGEIIRSCSRPPTRPLCSCWRAQRRHRSSYSSRSRADIAAIVVVVRLVGESTDPKTRGWEHEDHRHVSFCPSARKPTTSPPTMTLKLIASVAFLLCARSLAFVAVVPPGGVACVSGTTGVPAVSSKTSISTISDSATAAAGLQHNGSKPRRSRCWPSLLITSSSKSKSSTPENNVAPANGLTTSTEEKQTGGGGRGREGRLHLESDIFVPEPGSTVSFNLANTVTCRFSGDSAASRAVVVAVVGGGRCCHRQLIFNFCVIPHTLHSGKWLKYFQVI